MSAVCDMCGAAGRVALARLGRVRAAKAAGSGACEIRARTGRASDLPERSLTGRLASPLPPTTSHTQTRRSR